MIPTFAVVGHPNKGKSSIVATLAEDERLAIGPTPGTTRRAVSHTFSIDDQPQYVLVDTLGGDGLVVGAHGRGCPPRTNTLAGAHSRAWRPRVHAAVVQRGKGSSMPGESGISNAFRVSETRQ